MYSDFERILTEKGLKLKDVANATGVAYSSLTDWKAGRSKPKYERMKKIADFLGVSVDYLLTGEEPKGEKTVTVYRTSLTEEELNKAIMTAFRNQYYDDVQTVALAQAMKDNEQLHALFDAAKDASPEDLKTVYDMLLLLKQRGKNAD